MSGTWIQRKADQHQCRTPRVDNDPTVHPGDIWQCDHCGTHWRVHEHQIDGPYLIAVPGTGKAPT